MTIVKAPIGFLQSALRIFLLHVPVLDCHGWVFGHLPSGTAASGEAVSEAVSEAVDEAVSQTKFKASSSKFFSGRERSLAVIV